MSASTSAQENPKPFTATGRVAMFYEILHGRVKRLIAPMQKGNCLGLNRIERVARIAQSS